MVEFANTCLHTLVCTQVVVKSLRPYRMVRCAATFPDAILAVVFMISFAKTKLTTQHVEKGKI
jgi:hypothetical protein